MPKLVNIHEAKTHLSRLLEDVLRGEEIILARSGKPVARLVPLEAPAAVPLGFVPGCVPSSFFEPLPPGWDGQ